MKSILIGAALCAASIVTAEARPMTSRMFCNDVQRVVAGSGTIVLGFTPTTYDRVVTDQRFCLPTEGLEPINVPTMDTPYCLAGYTCKEGGSNRRR